MVSTTTAIIVSLISKPMLSAYENIEAIRYREPVCWLECWTSSQFEFFSPELALAFQHNSLSAHRHLQHPTSWWIWLPEIGLKIV